MADVKNSPRLEAIIKYARDLGEKHSTLVTAERYLVSVIDAVRGRYDIGDADLSAVAEILEQSGIDIDRVRDELLSHINGGNATAFLDDLYMKKKFFEASDKAREQGELSPEILLQCILDDPSDVIKKCIKGQKAPSTIEFDPAIFGGAKTNPDITDMSGSDSAGKTAAETAAEATNEPAADTAEAKTDAPAGDDLDALTARVREYREQIGKTVLGQDKAVSVVASGLFQAELRSMTDTNRSRPRATFLFAGTPGVGKTLLAETMAQVLGLEHARFDMSEYSDHDAAMQFCGSNKVYANSGSGTLTDFVSKNPQCVLLFDEIEKAHTKIIHLFLQILDAGRVRDINTNAEVSFKDAILIFTTNAGRQLYENSDTGDFSQVSRKVILKALETDVNPMTGQPFFPTAICSRFATGNVVMFNRMEAHHLRNIAKKKLCEQATMFTDRFGIEVKVDERIYDAILFAEGGEADARTINARSDAFLNDELFELFRLVDSDENQGDISAIKTISIDVELPEDDPELREMFEGGKDPDVLVFSDPAASEFCQGSGTHCRFLSAATVADGKKLLREGDVRVLLLDPLCGKRDDSALLNVEDVKSEARDFFHYVRENHRDLPVYLLQNEGCEYDEEEKLSFLRLGARGFVSLDGSFVDELGIICKNIHRQDNMKSLAKSNKLVTFETSQTITENGTAAEIRLFDFKRTVAVSAEDSDSILSGVSKPSVTFDKVIGAEDAKKELRYFVEYLKNPRKYLGTGVAAPKGVLLYGPPGTGKTLLAKAMASESNATFIAAEGNQFLKKYVGEGPEAVHELFRTARKYAPSIVFIDEIDAVAKARGGEDSAGRDEVLTAFLTEMDGFKNDPSKPVFVLAATNFDADPGSARSLDPAILRRFDRRILIDLPDKEARIRFMNMKISGNKAFEVTDVKVEEIAVRSTGMSLAQLESVFEMALRAAIRDGDLKVTDEILDEAFETFGSGERKFWNPDELERTARHEAGHAFICWLTGETPSYLTVVARANHGGYMLHGGDEKKGSYTRAELRGLIRTALGGRAAELVYYGAEQGLSTGASGDLANATANAQRLICNYGMDEELGLAVIDAEAARNGELSAEVRASVNRILSEEMQIAYDMIEANRPAIDAIVEVLMTKNHLNGVEIDEIFSGKSSR